MTQQKLKIYYKQITKLIIISLVISILYYPLRLILDLGHKVYCNKSSSCNEIYLNNVKIKKECLLKGEIISVGKPLNITNYLAEKIDIKIKDDNGKVFHTYGLNYNGPASGYETKVGGNRDNVFTFDTEKKLSLPLVKELPKIGDNVYVILQNKPEGLYGYYISEMIDNTKNLNYDLCERNVYYISFLFSKQLYLYEIKNIFENQRFNFTFENTKYFLQRALVIFTIISIFILSRKIFLEGFLFAKK